MHCGHFFEFWIWHVKVQRLGLADEGTPCGSQIDESSLWNLPNCFVEFFDITWDLADILHGSIVRNKLILDISCPQIDLNKIFDKVLVHADKLTSEHSPGVNVCGEWLKAFVVSEDLRGRSSWHWCD